MVTHEFIWLWLSSTIPLKISPFCVCVSLRIAPNTDRPRLNDLRFVNNRDDFWWHRKYPNEVGASSSGTANEHDGGKYFQSAVTLMYWSHCHSRWIFPLSVYFKIRITLLVSCTQGPIESWLLLLTQSLHIQIVFLGGGAVVVPCSRAQRQVTALRIWYQQPSSCEQFPTDFSRLTQDSNWQPNSCWLASLTARLPAAPFVQISWFSVFKLHQWYVVY